MQVIGNLKNISMASSKLLLAAKSLSVDPAAANAKNLLAAAARYTHTNTHTQQALICFVNESCSLCLGRGCDLFFLFQSCD